MEINLKTAHAFLSRAVHISVNKRGEDAIVDEISFTVWDYEGDDDETFLEVSFRNETGFEERYYFVEGDNVEVEIQQSIMHLVSAEGSQLEFELFFEPANLEALNSNSDSFQKFLDHIEARCEEEHGG